MTVYIYGWQDLIVRVKHEADGIKVRKATVETAAALNAFGYIGGNNQRVGRFILEYYIDRNTKMHVPNRYLRGKLYRQAVSAVNAMVIGIRVLSSRAWQTSK